MTFIDILKAIINALTGKTASQPVTNDEQHAPEPETAYPVKTDESMFRNYMLRGESAETIDTLWKQVVQNEQNGIYDYKLTGKIGWYHIKDGQLVGNGAIGK